MAQQSDPEMQKMAAQSKTELKWQKLQLYPQGIVYYVADGHGQMLVPQSQRQKTMENTMIFQLLDLWECNGLWTTSNEQFGGATYMVMSDNTCGLVCSVS